MKSIPALTATLGALLLASCASSRNDDYDTANPYGIADVGQVPGPIDDPNPVYDTPAAYEETAVNTPAAPPMSPTMAPAAPSAPSNGAAIIHTVVRGDTLSGLSAKYNVPAAAIRQANGMTNDIVVLGRKMVIPPAR